MFGFYIYLKKKKKKIRILEHSVLAGDPYCLTLQAGIQNLDRNRIELYKIHNTVRDGGGEKFEEGGGAVHTHSESISRKHTAHSSRPTCTHSLSLSFSVLKKKKNNWVPILAQVSKDGSSCWAYIASGSHIYKLQVQTTYYLHIYLIYLCLYTYSYLHLLLNPSTVVCI